MDSGKVLYLLGLLSRETSGSDAQLLALYQRALDEHDEIMRLRRLLEECVFYNELGRGIHAEGSDALARIYREPASCLELLPRVAQSSERIESELRICEGWMSDPAPFRQDITVLRKRDVANYMTALRAIAASCVYLISVYSGPEAVGRLSWDDRVGIQEMLYAVNTRFLPALCAAERPSYCWVIRRRRLGGRALFGGDALYLSYEDIGEAEVLRSALHSEPIGTHAFLNINAFESEETNIPLCWGIGNLVSCGPDVALEMLNKRLVTHLRAPHSAELQRRMPGPLPCLRVLSDGRDFCVSPEELHHAMNQWLIGMYFPAAICSRTTSFKISVFTGSSPENGSSKTKSSGSESIAIRNWIFC